MLQSWNETACLALTARQERIIRGAAVAVVFLLLVLMVEASPAAPAGVEAEPGGPTMRLQAPGGTSANALGLETTLKLDISGLLAQATLTQTFRNDTAQWREAEYLLPLPPDTAVTHLEMRVGERRIIGTIRERAQARQVFDAARKAGKRSALMEQQRPHLFTTRVANVPPGEEIEVQVQLLLPVRYRDGEFSLRFPTTVTPVYIPGVTLPRDEDRQSGPSRWLPLTGSGWASATNEVPDAPLISALQYAAQGSDSRPLNSLSVSVTLQPGMPLADVDALYHDFDVQRQGDGFLLKLRNGPVEMDRDLVLRWRPRGSALPQAAVFRETFDGEDFALLMLLPPIATEPVEPLPREMLLVIDVSGSMQGEPIRQARQSVLHALNALSPDDYVNIIAFNNRLRVLFPRAQAATGATLEAAKAFVRHLEADGGTEMLPALASALRAPPPVDNESAPAPLRQLLFITDGAVGNEDAMLELLEAEGGRSRLFTVGIGSAPNGYFMHRAASIGRGEALFIARPQEVAPELDALFARLERPMASDMQVHWPATVEAFPQQIPDLYAGQPLLQVVRLDDARSTESVRVSGRVAGRAWERQLALGEGGSDVGVARHWARSKLKALLGALLRGEQREVVRSEALPLALRFSLVSPFTSFVAVEDEPLRPARAPLLPGQVSNTRPQGQAPQTFAFAQGATTGPAKVYFGAFFAFMALFAFALSRREPDQ
jgi:Ca-activated chloride channel family protein